MKRQQHKEIFTTVVKPVGNGAHILVDKSLVDKTVRVTIEVIED